MMNNGNSEKVTYNASPCINSVLTSNNTLHTSIATITLLLTIRMTLACSEKYVYTRVGEILSFSTWNLLSDELTIPL
jgi:hypothetical protein